jgi:hypothetical protein
MRLLAQGGWLEQRAEVPMRREDHASPKPTGIGADSLEPVTVQRNNASTFVLVLITGQS